MPRFLTGLFALACGLCVANVYYAQPLLDLLARDFGMTEGAVGGVVTATQAGSALALLLLVPLGDRLDRRRLMLTQLLLLAGALMATSLARSPTQAMAALLVVGLLGTAMTQGLIAYAAAAAEPAARGRAVGAAQGGVVIGLLMARVVSGGVADLAGWRAVYLCAAVAALALCCVLWRTLPVLPTQTVRLAYPALLRSLATLLRRDRVLQIRGMLAMLMFAAFNIFWSALVLPLGAPPHSLSHTTIGAFGLAGVAGALGALRAGAWADRGQAQRVTGLALGVLVLAWLPIALLPWSLVWLVVGIVLLDLGGQAIHVTNQSLILRARPDAHSRLVGGYMMFYAVGSGLGAVAATRTYAAAGWNGVCLLGAVVSLAAMAFWAATRRVVKRALAAPA